MCQYPFPANPEPSMPLTPRERRAIWHARQHYLNEFMTYLDAATANADTPTLTVAALHSSLTYIRDRIAAENPDAFDTYIGQPIPKDFSDAQP